jgi:hypothetical protein
MEATKVKKIIGTTAATTVHELISALEEMVLTKHQDTTYVTINSDSIRLSLVRETLTDGSKVYNVEYKGMS